MGFNKSDSFDLVTCIEVLEHIPDFKNALYELKRISKNWIIITVPYEQNLKTKLCPHCLKTFYVDGHIHSFSSQKLKDICEVNGFSVVKIERYTNNPFRSKTLNIFYLVLTTIGILKKRKPKYIGLLCYKK